MTTISRRLLSDALAAVSVGDYVEVAVTPTQLQLTGSDLETTVQRTIAVDGAPAAAAVTVPTRLLAAALKSVVGDAVTVALSPSAITMSSPTSRSSVAQQGRVAVVPQVPAAAWRALSPTAALQLRDVVSSTIGAALDDSGRPAASGVRLEADGGGGLVAVALDGARLHRCVAASPELSALPPHTLPRGCCATVAAALSAAEPVKVKTAKPKKGVVAAAVVEAVPPPPSVRVAVGSRYVAFEVGSAADTTLVVCRRAPEPFPEWRRILDNGTACDAAVRVSAATLLAAVRSLPADAVTLSATSAELTLDYVVTDETGVRRLGDGSTAVDAFCSRSAAAAAVKVSTRYLADALAGCGEDVELRMSAGQPLRLSSGGFDAVVMFLR